ncbi:hypothetical protein ACFSJ3_13355 [Corallincola platygyrae]|uniref:STAS/SEC14 domain-containing protein n=1 Tax=Corallincola platygyrae TaxID=1193278 RepID=A0ABW4XPS9_9GAMM
MKFEAHGQFDFSVKNHVLIVEARGPFNLEAARTFEVGVKKTVTTYLAGVKWAMLARLHGDGIYTPDSLPLLQSLHLWRIKHGLRRIAIVFAQPESKAISSVIETQFNKVYQASDADICLQRFFDTDQEAQAWLSEEGYPC